MSYYFKCPRCKSDDEFTVPSEDSGGIGCLMLIFGGIIPFLLYSSATCNRIQCSHCGYIFRQPPLPNSPVSKLAKSILLLLLLFIFAGVVAISEPAFGSLLPQVGWIENLSLKLSENAYAATFCILVFLLLLAVVSALASMASNARFRAEFWEQHKTQPARSNIKPRP